MAKRKANIAIDITDLAMLGAVGFGAYLLWQKFGSPSATGIIDSIESTLSPTAANADMGGEDFGTSGSSW